MLFNKEVEQVLHLNYLGTLITSSMINCTEKLQASRRDNWVFNTHNAA